MAKVVTYGKCLIYKLLSFFDDRQSGTPIFPHFKEISFEDRNVIEQYTNNFAPYSDFNFTSFYTWNVEGEHAYTFIHGKLIIRLADYITGKPVYSLLAKGNLERSFQELQKYCRSVSDGSISLIPEITASSLQDSSLVDMYEDENNHDYIFSLKELSELKGRRYKNKRQAANKCERENNICFETFSLITEVEVAAVSEIINKWQIEKQHSVDAGNESDTEIQALQRAFTHFNEHGAMILSLAYDGNTVVGFSIDELLVDGYVMSHYFKTLASITGLSEHFNRHVAKVLHEKQYRFWNWEQDLGMIELKNMKSGYRPISKLKKYKLLKV